VAASSDARTSTQMNGSAIALHAIMSVVGRILRQALGAASVAAAFSSEARAQTSVPQTMVARGLYDQAAAAMARKDYEAAYPMLEEALRLEPAALGARLALAECYESADKLASAWATYAIVEQEAIKAKQPDRQQRAHERAAAIEPRLAKLAIEVPEAVSKLPGLDVKRDGVAVGPAQWGVPLPADKGSHLIAVEASGRQTFMIVFEILADGITARATIAEPALPSYSTSWWEMRTPPPAPRRTVKELPAVRAPPPPPQRGVPTVDLMGPQGLELCEVTPAGVEACSPPAAKVSWTRSPSGSTRRSAR
jgi:hypothetical protein